MKTKNIKKVLCLVLSFIMLTSMFVFASYAEAESCTHHYDGYTAIVPATCHSTGSEKWECTKCHMVSIIEIPIDESKHNYVIDRSKSIPATYEKNGLDYYVCSECGAVKKEVTEKYCPLHNEDAWESSVKWDVTKEPNCVEVGKKQAYCTECKRIIVKDIPAKGHTEAELIPYPATCTNNGIKDDGMFCTVCQAVTKEPTVIPAGHKYIVKKVSLPDCDATGIEIVKCENCDYLEIVEIPMLPHEDADADGFCDNCSTRICRCFCHNDTMFSRFVRFINTLLNSLLKKTGSDKFRCCDCMAPYNKA